MEGAVCKILAADIEGRAHGTVNTGRGAAPRPLRQSFFKRLLDFFVGLGMARTRPVSAGYAVIHSRGYVSQGPCFVGRGLRGP